MKMLPAFVYGTLRNGGGNYEWILAGRTVSEQPATFAGGQMFDTGGFPYVIDTGDKTDVVVGELMHIEPSAYKQTLAYLDGLEGFRSEGNPRNHYDRRVETVTDANGDEHEAYIYLVPVGRVEEIASRLPAVESGDWMAYVGERTNRIFVGM